LLRRCLAQADIGLTAATARRYKLIDTVSLRAARAGDINEKLSLTKVPHRGNGQQEARGTVPSRLRIAHCFASTFPSVFSVFSALLAFLPPLRFSPLLFPSLSSRSTR
jgi:hypothetical protein